MQEYQMLETICQLVAIIAGIFGGIRWLIAFLQKKFDFLLMRMTALESKLDDKVTEELCKERRAHFPCCTGDGTFKCPVATPDEKVIKLMQRITTLLQKQEEKLK